MVRKSNSMHFHKIGLFFIFLPCLVHSFNCISKDDKVFDTELTTPREWIDKAIVSHNKYRAMHNASALVFNATLCRSAQWTANENLKIGLVHTSKMPQRFKMSCGENLFMASGKLREYDPGEPGDSWYAEELDYNYETGKTKDIRKPVGHFTQLVWKASEEMCIAYASSGKRFVAAAHYFPKGNYKRRYLENVGAKTTAEKEKPKVSPWVELNCKKSAKRRFKCRYSQFLLQLFPTKNKKPLSKKERKEMMSQMIERKSHLVYVEAPMKNS